MVGVGIWAEYELDQDILQSFNSARNATDIMSDLRNTVGQRLIHSSWLYRTHSMYNLLGQLEW